MPDCTERAMCHKKLLDGFSIMHEQSHNMNQPRSSMAFWITRLHWSKSCCSYFLSTMVGQRGTCGNEANSNSSTGLNRHDSIEEETWKRHLPESALKTTPTIRRAWHSDKGLSRIYTYNPQNLVSQTPKSQIYSGTSLEVSLSAASLSVWIARALRNWRRKCCASWDRRKWQDARSFQRSDLIVFNHDDLLDSCQVFVLLLVDTKHG